MKTLFDFLKKNKWAAGIAALVLILAAVGFSSRSANAADAAETVKVTTLGLAESVDASGTLEAQPFAALGWKTAGVVAEVRVKPGQKVKKGDVLLKLQPDSTTASIAAAQADLVNAQQARDDLLASDSELAQAVIDLKEAREEYNDKSRYLEYLHNDKNIPLNESYGWIERGKGGSWTYVYKSKSYRGPATEDMLTEAENNLELARADLEDAQRKMERLQDKGQDALAAQAKVDAAQATVNSMQIVAPFDGQALSVEDRVGDVVSAGQLSVNLADMKKLYVTAQVDESDVAQVSAGNPVRITLDALPAQEFSGAVESINPVGQVISGLVKYDVLIRLDEVGSASFIPLGTTANVYIQVKEEAAALAVPIAAIQNDSTGEFVWLAQADGSAKRVDVVTGAIVGDQVIVTGDLQAGDPIQLVARENGFKAPNPFGGKE